MGSRAVITTICTIGDPQSSSELGVYLHTNGDPTSVTAFLEYCRAKDIRSPNDDYGWARLCQVIGNYFGGTLSVGIDKCCNLDCDNGENGVYIIDNWDIVSRKYIPEDKDFYVDMVRLHLMMNEIDIRQPTHLGEDRIHRAWCSYVERYSKKDYTKLINSLRICTNHEPTCKGCSMLSHGENCDDDLMIEAADTIEELMNRVKELEAQND